jgi:hypothetical protein
MCLVGLLAVSACSSGRSVVEDFPAVEDRDDLVDGLRALGYDIDFLSPALFTGPPDPVAAYRVTQPDGRAFRLPAFSPDDYRLLRNNSALNSQVRPQIFRKGSVVVVFSNYQTDLYYDLEQLLGRPTY